MTPLDRLHGLKINPVLTEGGNLHLDRPEDITDETWEQAVNLAKQNKAAIVAALKGSCPSESRSSKRLTPSMLQAWRTARPWILDHLQELEAKGWTRKMLFRADVLTHPHGKWGPAWSRNWTRPGTEPSIDQDGAIVWTWLEPNGRPVSQAARPKP
jgi:hypothetical protein